MSTIFSASVDVRLWLLCLICLLTSCSPSDDGPRATLPILGRHVLMDSLENDKKRDTLYHSIRDFRLLNQDNHWVTGATFEDKVYVANFFFTSCPTICPIMAKNMLKVYEKYRKDPRVGIISHTIDPEYDDASVLKKYANGLQVESKTWHFVTGDKAYIYDLAIQSYLSVALEDSTAPGGYLHSGAFLLVDQKKRIRGVYDGTITTSIDHVAC